MRRGSWRLLILLCIVGSFLILTNGRAKVLISKIQISGASTTDEFVELYNFSSSSFSLENWSLKKQTAGGTQSNLITSFPAVTLNPFGYFLVAHRDYSPIGGITADFFYSNASVSLASNNSLLLLEPAGSIADRVDWGSVTPLVGSPAPNPSNSRSLVRLPNNEQGNFIDTDDSSLDFGTFESSPFNSLSPGRPLSPIDTPPPTTTESVPVTPTSTDSAGMPPSDTTTTAYSWVSLRLNEIMPNPATGTEWVELFNSSSSTINLTGGSLCDNRSDNCAIATLSGVMQPGWFTVFLTGSHLNNDGDSIILKDPSGIVIDQITYGSAELSSPTKGQSLARVVDGVDTDSAGDWSLTEVPTPDAANIIVIPPPAQPPTPVASSGGTSIIAPIVKNLPTKAVTPATPRVNVVWSLNIPSVVMTASSTLFDVHLSADPRGGENLYAWDFGDGTAEEGSQIWHTYATSGTYLVTIVATSSAGTVGSKKLLVTALSNAPQTGVVLSGIQPRPDATEDEWIEIQNTATTSIDLGGWKLGTNKDQWYVIPASTTLNAGITRRFFQTATHLTLENAGGTVFLVSPRGLADRFDYGKGKMGQIFSNVETATPTQAVLAAKVEKIQPLYHVMSTVEARHRPTGSLVWLDGVVESLPGAPGTNYFYVRDASGGIQIYSYKKDFPALELGDRIRVYGEVGFFENVPRVKIKSHSAVARISSGLTSSTELASLAEFDESDLGTLVTVTGEISKLKSTYLYLDDGTAEALLSLPTKAGINKKELHEGDTIRVTALAEQSSGGWRLLPRSNTDIKVIEKPLQPESFPSHPHTNLLLGTTGGLLLIAVAGALKKWVL